MENKRRIGLLAMAVVVALIELGAIYSSMEGDPIALVDGWGSTRQVDVLAVILAVVGCGALFVTSRYPTASTVVATLAYCLFILRDYEFGMTLPAMVAIFIIMVRGRKLNTASIAAVCCLAASLVWIARRSSPIEDSGVSILVWVAFGTVAAVFFLGPLFAGELVWIRRQLRAAGSPVSDC